MALNYSLLDVFADAPFQGTQIPVVLLGDSDCDDQTCTNIASEFQQTETVFIRQAGANPGACVYNASGRALFGAHTILAASYAAHEVGLTRDQGAFASYLLQQNEHQIESFIDKSGGAAGSVQFARTLTPTVDRFAPEISKLARVLNTEERHISFSKYKPLVVSVDHPTLIVPFTRPEHVLAARLDSERWHELLSELYTTELFLFAPGSLTGGSEFHGRLLNPDLARGVYPPIGKVMPEFIAYLAEQPETAEGTHTFSIDRGSMQTRKSVLRAEFDKRAGRSLRCRIGGHVIKMGTGTLLVP